MKHVKMSRRTHNQPVERTELERMEQELVEFEHKARLARQNLYGNNQPDLRGWVDKKIQ